MTVTAPPRPPHPPERDTPDDLEALIEEARRRARRRRLRNAAAVVAVAAIAVGGFVAWHGGRTGTTAKAITPAPRPKPVPLRPLPRNGEIAVVQGNDLIAIAPDGSRRQALTTCPGPNGDCYFGTFSWSPDGSFLVFLAGHIGGAVTANNLSLYVIGVGGSGPRLLARCGNCNQFQELSWSPDGRRVVFFADDGLYVVNVVSGALRRLDLSGTTATWSPSESRIAFATGDGLFTVSPRGSGLVQIAETGGGASDPKWSPDGTKLAFDADDDLYVVDADGSHLKLLLGGALGSGPGVPTWSPNGRRILYFYTPGSPGRFRGEVWSLKADGSDRRRLYRGACCVGDWQPPIWSPDGRWIAFSGATETSGVVVMDARGTHRRRVLGLSSFVAWQPLPRGR
jgi:dipeptidyl aminopeptidase/acylaminoacyl peptidase